MNDVTLRGGGEGVSNFVTECDRREEGVSFNVTSR